MNDETYEPVYDADGETVHDCPMCGGNYVVLGELGNRQHCRCRDCHWTFSYLIDPS
jgi:transposase-like protein